MPEFSYQGVDKFGKRVSGKMEAPNEGELRIMLRGQGVRPVRIGKVGLLEADLGAMFGMGQGPVPTDVLAIFTRQLHVLIASGIPLVQSLEILADQVTNPQLRRILVALKEKVSSGSFLWEALSDYSGQFPRIYVALIRAGETSGAMEIILDRLAKYLETADKLAKQLKSAMMYPIIVTVIGIVVVGAMVVFVIPQFESLLSNAGKALPAPTQFLIDLSDFVTSNLHYIVGGTGLAIYLLKTYFATNEGRGVLHRIVFRMPIFGTISQRAGTARFTRTMGTLLGSGVNLIDAIEICKATVDNVVIEESVAKIRGEIESGKTLGMTMANMKVFPRMASQMIAVGEQTGNLEKMLDRVATIYETEVENLVAGLSKLIEPIILVVLGGAVAGIMVAMYLPVFQMGDAVGG